MTLQDLANISQIAQAVLVVVSLGFIWYQLREGVRLVKSEKWLERKESEKIG